MYLLLTIAILVAGLWFWPLLVAGGGLALLGLYCYLWWSPVAYEVADDTLTVYFRAGRKQFPGVTRCEPVTQPLSMWTTVRVCGNGGLLAGAGLFYNRRWGLFRAYVTCSDVSRFVLVKTSLGKVLISPADPSPFIANLAHREYAR